MAAEPLVVDIKRNALDDGPGIRTVVFFKGCTLRCVWCQNPESLSHRAEIQREPERCVACGACADACPEHIARPGDQPETRREACRLCQACVEACSAGARRVAGRSYAPDQLADLLARDEPFYRHSGGGVTLSGGEPAMHAAFAGEVARRLRGRGVHVLVETAGHFAWDAFEKHLLPNVDAIYYDVKIADPADHQRLVGQHNRRILDNLKRLSVSGFPDLLPRVPLIPGITDTPANLRDLSSKLSLLGLARIMLLPYNPLWVSKRRALSMEMPYANDTFMSDDEIERCRDAFTKAGLEVVG